VVLGPDPRIAVQRAEPHRHLGAVRPGAAEQARPAHRAERLDRAADGVAGAEQDARLVTPAGDWTINVNSDEAKEVAAYWTDLIQQDLISTDVAVLEVLGVAVTIVGLAGAAEQP
jgi:hypothetical protein